jgi:hypothetical protein
MSEAIRDWDSSLNRLVEEETARQVADLRAYLIAEISRAISHSDASEPRRLAEIAVDTMIESTRKIRFRSS